MLGGGLIGHTVSPDQDQNDMCRGAFYDQQTCRGCDCLDDLSAPLGRDKMHFVPAK